MLWWSLQMLKSRNALTRREAVEKLGAMQEVRLATTEFFMPILVGMELPDFESYVRFCLFENSHDLSTSIWTRDDRKLQLGREVLIGEIHSVDQGADGMAIGGCVDSD